MAYLYLNFAENLQSGSKNWDDFYTESLSDQYKNLKKKLGSVAPDTLQAFIQGVLAEQVDKRFYISIPGFDRNIKTNKRGKQCIYNIVIRPEHDLYADYFLPKNSDLILIGDLTFDSVVAVTVKGIELIDTAVVKFGEKVVCCKALCAFTKKTILNRNTGKSFDAPDYGSRELYEPVLTNDFIYMLCKQCYPVPHPEQAIWTLEEWKKYISFRKYYLKIQSERCEEVDGVSVCNSYILTKESFRRNKDRLTAFLLDGVSEFGKGEQVIIDREESGAESFPLIRVDIRKNRKAVLFDTIGNGGKGKPKFEVHLRRYTNEAMGLSSSKPNYDENGNIPKGYRFDQYLLGERYLFTYVDEEPDCTALERRYEKSVKEQSARIDSKYASIIAGDLDKYAKEIVPGLKEKYQKSYSDYERELAASLQKEIEENSDKEIIKKYESEVLAPARAANKKEQDQLKVRLKKAEMEGDEENTEKLRGELAATNEQLEEKLADAQKETPISTYYIARNNRRLEEKKKSLDISRQAEYDRLLKERKSNLERQYSPVTVKEKEDADKVLKKQLADERAQKIEDETVRCYRIYFRPSGSLDKPNDIKKEIDGVAPKYLIYDNRAEKAKIDRQERALRSINEGYVRNPFLATYLFAPETLRADNAAEPEPDWYLPSLNERQKLAVRRALASESLFLLQGPPGTGKTQVIAELTAQFAKCGKKVLISSETHKAIDNVFERLPKIPEIRPLRLIPTQNKKETNYSPEKLVDNFYKNIADMLDRQIARYEHFEDTKANFNEEMGRLRAEYSKLLGLREQNIRIEGRRGDLTAAVNRLNIEYESLRGELTLAKAQTELCKRTKKGIENLNFSSDDVDEQTISRFRSVCEELCGEFSLFKNFPATQLGGLMQLDLSVVRNDISALLEDDRIAVLEAKRNELRERLKQLRDPDTDEPPQEGEEKFELYKQYQTQLKQTVSEIKQAKDGGAADISQNQTFRLFPQLVADRDACKALPDELAIFQVRLRNAINNASASVDEKISECNRKEGDIQIKIAEKQKQISENKREYEALSESAPVAEYGELNSSLKRKIAQFFHDFGIVREYDPSDLEAAFDIISEEWRKLEYDHKRTEEEDKKKVPVYREIAKYLMQEDILEDDRRTYTRDLYECVNVFGITCTSRDRFTKEQIEELGKYGIASVDIRTQGIDVVIVDEVSKSSFLDLLIPILYGKTIILVGDHRQLPPMYDLRHMRDEDFEGLDENIINREINEEFTNLYEECFFKTLYEKVPEDFRVMLNRQYRCHSHIMEVFNHFYGGSQNGLVVGTKQQDNEKEHNLTVKINGNTVIDPKHHIYFVDCDQNESSAYEGSTSKINEQEAEVSIALLRALDTACEEQVAAHKIRVNKEKGIDERPSVGIICTYGDQAGLIKRKRKSKKFSGFSEKQDEKLIISTVDDFQGDERDIIIVSMVRNPAPGKRYDAEFIKKFERINVAFSRARKLLIILGSRKFLSEAGIIDLPDLSGNKALDKKNFPVFHEIIQTIDFCGRVLRASDILGE